MVADLSKGGAWPGSSSARAGGGLIALIAHALLVLAWLLQPSLREAVSRLRPVDVRLIQAPQPLPDLVSLPQAPPLRPPPPPMVAIPEVQVPRPAVAQASITVQPVAPQPSPEPAPSAPATEAVAGPASAPGPAAAAQPPPPARHVNISQVAYLRAPELAYPLPSRRAREEGRVEVQVLVDAAGAPRQAVLLRSSGHDRLDEAALAAVRAARFKPYTEDGIARAFRVVVPLIFELDT
jgi:periplasmic protein TonB